jgi:CheY-like chemotaxis protein
MAWTVLIVDDHAGFRGFARRLLEADGFTVVGEAGDGISALAAADDQRPEIVLLDVVLPDIDGFAVADRLAEKGQHRCRVLTSAGGGRLRRASPAQPGDRIHPLAALSGAALAARLRTQAAGSRRIAVARAAATAAAIALVVHGPARRLPAGWNWPRALSTTSSAGSGCAGRCVAASARQRVGLLMTAIGFLDVAQDLYWDAALRSRSPCTSQLAVPDDRAPVRRQPPAVTARFERAS